MPSPSKFLTTRCYPKNTKHVIKEQVYKNKKLYVITSDGIIWTLYENSKKLLQSKNYEKIKKILEKKKG